LVELVGSDVTGFCDVDSDWESCSGSKIVATSVNSLMLDMVRKVHRSLESVVGKKEPRVAR